MAIEINTLKSIKRRQMVLKAIFVFFWALTTFCAALSLILTVFRFDEITWQNVGALLFWFCLGLYNFHNLRAIMSKKLLIVYRFELTYENRKFELEMIAEAVEFILKKAEQKNTRMAPIEAYVFDTTNIPNYGSPHFVRRKLNWYVLKNKNDHAIFESIV